MGFFGLYREHERIVTRFQIQRIKRAEKTWASILYIPSTAEEIKVRGELVPKIIFEKMKEIIFKVRT